MIVDICSGKCGVSRRIDQKCLDTRLNFIYVTSATSATFAVLDLIFIMYNTTPLLVKVIFLSQKHRCLRHLTVFPLLFPSTFSILILYPLFFLLHKTNNNELTVCRVTQERLVALPLCILRRVVISYTLTVILNISSYDGTVWSTHDVQFIYWILRLSIMINFFSHCLISDRYETSNPHLRCSFSDSGLPVTNM